MGWRCIWVDRFTLKTLALGCADRREAIQRFTERVDDSTEQVIADHGSICIRQQKDFSTRVQAGCFPQRHHKYGATAEVPPGRRHTEIYPLG